MRIFRFSDPLDPGFAQAGRLGTWYPDPSPGVCPECGASRQKRVPPLIIEWLPGSDVVGDFVWPGGEVVVSERVRTALEARFYGFEFKRVEMWQDPSLKPPRRTTKRIKPRVWLPYERPPLYDLWITTWTHADLEHSSLRLINDCPVCGYRAYVVEGIEERKSRWEPTQKDLVDIHTPRGQGQGIYLHQKDLQGADIFRLHELPKWILCTERVKVLIEEKRLTNVSFLEVGETLR